MNLKSKFGKYYKSKAKFITAGWISIIGGFLWISPFLYELNSDLQLCYEHMNFNFCSNILYFYAIPALIIFMGSVYLYLGYKQKKANFLINISAFIITIAVLIGALFVPGAMISCILAPDPLCPVGGMLFLFAGGVIAILGLVIFIVGLLSTIVQLVTKRLVK